MSIQVTHKSYGTAPFYQFTQESKDYVAAKWPTYTYSINDTDSTRVIVEIWATPADLAEFNSDAFVKAEQALNDAYNLEHQIITDEAEEITV